MRISQSQILMGFFTLIFCSTDIFAYDWPVKPFTSRHDINSTLGEYRSGHFHSGVDINEPEDDTVFAVAAGVTHDSTATTIWVGDFRYVHINVLVPNNVTLDVHDVVGVIDISNHLHFREKTDTTTPYNAINPLRNGALYSYIDSTKPHIDSILFYRQGTDTLLSGALNSTVDILCVAGDTRTDTIGHAPTDTGNVSVYKIGYEIKDTLGNVRQSWERIIFDTLPDPSNDAQLALTYGSGSNNSHFRYWVTNDPFNADTSLRNSYWNTMSVADGQYWVKVIAKDIKENEGVDSVRVTVNNPPRILGASPGDGAT